MEYGLLPLDLFHIKEVFAAFPKVRQVILFGSRAKGNYKTGSDIDLAIIGDNVLFEDILEIDARLEQLGLLYKFDLKNFKEINDPEVTAHIKRAGKIIFQAA